MLYYGSHGISHCSNDTCHKKFTCERYLAHLDAISEGGIYSYCGFHADKDNNYTNYVPCQLDLGEEFNWKEKRMYNKYPIFLQEMPLGETLSCLGRGIECSTGWYGIVNKLCREAEMLNNNLKYASIVAEQIKEKYGDLCVYWSVRETAKLCEVERDLIESYSKKMCKYVDTTQKSAERTCEACGASGDDVRKYTDGWWRVRCKRCEEGRKACWRDGKC